MTYANILIEHDDAIAVVILNRPKVLNALNRATMDEVVTALEALDHDDAVRCIVLTGSERAFAAGADINEFAAATPVEMLAGYRFQQWERIRQIAKPVIAAVRGFALGGGCELAMLCDMIVAGEGARFGQPEINLGLMPGAGGTQRLTRAVGKARAMEIILTGRQVTAAEAYAMGLITRVVPDEVVVETAKDIARQIAAKAPVAVRLAKDAVLAAFDTTLEVGLDYERKLFYLLFATEDRQEGVRAFLEKRPAAFRGR
ncbi:MAG: enoyl-CoA hydratase-related protein [Armatimonadota bacterium]|nr:enoyl-CoA hydratase-related protein [Armatimonadota bacterium]MDR7422646.1 enoyl-CoA hydratase-related protein [Armatimonadota bacterium]MDR7453395.1 enoyl-CoA hydratase-related protein [Armatimonadota bacterium]MDR7457932.1 enoyl-CoA hydratase-related protein [Armatimonadota bacterium]MDR7496045.1 enoyl-CoA hydratase-related protein [Armatimonadota bacterium]